MNSLLHVFVVALAALAPIVNPVGALAAFAGLTSSFDRKTIKSQAIKTAVYAAVILITFTLFGSVVLQAFGISMQAVQVAGGLVVAHSGYSMLSSKPSLSKPERDQATTLNDVSFSPMALPLIAGPGAIGVVIALSARHTTWPDKLMICLACVVVALFIGLLLRLCTPWVEHLGPTGVGALTRIMGFFILCIGVELIAQGLLPMLNH